MTNQFDWAAKWALYSPHKLAFAEHETGRTLSFSQLNRLGNRLSFHLMEIQQLQKGDRIAVLAENCLEYLILFAAAQKTGVILVPLNYRLATAEIDFLLENSSPKLLLFDAKFEDKLNSSQSRKNIPFQQSMAELAAFCREKTTGAEDEFVTQTGLQESDPIFVLYTSGTTGFPKGALYTHGMLFWNSINTSLSLIINSTSRSINCMPPFHTGGWNVLLTPFFHHGAYTCLMKSFDAETVLQLIETERASIFMAVPTMLQRMADLPAFAQADLSSLHYVIVGGEPMPIPLIEQWHEKGVPVRQGFGMTEVGPNLTSLHQEDAVRKMGSIGRPNFYVHTKIVNEQGEPCRPNEAGELLLRGPVVTPGYWRNEEATQKTFEGDWFRTGDRVKQDEEGYLFVVDRIKNMYISGGENVYPAEIERVLRLHSMVNEVAVIGVPDAKWGEVGKAFVVAKEAASDADLLAHCRTKLAKFKVPKSIHFLEELPKNDSGKIDRKALK